MSALDELIEKREKGERLTSLEFAVFWCSDAIASEQAAKELADYELRLDLLAKGATWEHEDNERLKEDNAALRARVEALEHLEAIAEDVNEWLKTSANLKGSAHQRELEAALKS